MADSSVGTTVSFNAGDDGDPVASSEIRSVSVSSDAQSLVDATGLGTEFKTMIVGQVENAVVTVVTLDKPAWARSDAKGTLRITFGAAASGTPPTNEVRYYNCVMSEISASVGVDAAVEYTFVFTSLNNVSGGGAGGGISP